MLKWKEHGTLPYTFHVATINLILKPEKDIERKVNNRSYTPWIDAKFLNNNNKWNPKTLLSEPPGKPIWGGGESQSEGLPLCLRTNQEQRCPRMNAPGHLAGFI